ncbi:MAG: DNA repair protein RadC [Desulfovibrio sp.]|jgi:DNA repair protein RadC|nr:DNA repair protein RadC [Desulfovibrio sp.]
MTVELVSAHMGHRSRLRSRFERDPSVMAEYEVLELLLGYGLTRKDTKPLAKELLARFGSIRGVLDARPDELMAVPGFGSGLMSFWRVLHELLARHAASAVYRREELVTPEAVARMASARLAGCPHEECWLALVDNRNRMIAWERLCQGGINAIAVQPRDVLEKALAHKAAGIILVHNHPGGCSEPSRSDIDLTNELRQLSPRLGVRFLDHVIITDEDCCSLEHGRIARQSGGI